MISAFATAGTIFTIVASIYGLYLAERLGHVSTRKAAIRVSRYPLFEARDRLIRLVLDGKMSQDDPAWRCAYEAANCFLDPRYETNIYQLVKSRRAAASTKASSTPDQDETFRCMRDAARLNPEYQAALLAVADAFVDMAIMQSQVHHRLWLTVRAAIARTSTSKSIGDHLEAFAVAATGAARAARRQSMA